MFIGDISLGEHFFSFGHGPRTHVENGVNIFSGVEQVLCQADYVIGNLEGPLSDIGYSSSDPLKRVFRGSPNSVVLLKYTGINVLNFANNHSLQHGESSFDDTVRHVKEAGLKCVGLKNNDGQIGHTIIENKFGLKIGIVAASDIEDNSFPLQNKYNVFEVDSICKKIYSMNDICDAVIVVLHWGEEGKTKTDQRQKDIAERLFRCGALAVIGHHPHVFYEVERNNGTILAPSLGDFVFDLPWDACLTNSGILDISIDKKGSIYSAIVWPVKLNIYGFPQLTGNPKAIHDNEILNIYQYNKNLKFQNIKKLIYFIIFLLKGDSLTKIRFLKWKTRSFFRKLIIFNS